MVARMKQALRRAPVALFGVAALASTSARAEGVADAGKGAEEPPYHLTIGLRGTGGVLLEDGESRSGGGGGLLLGIPIVHERWEVELSAALLAAQDEGRVTVYEAIAKRVFERKEALAPHVLLGPVLSLDLGEEFRASAGVVMGVGATYWFHPRVGLVADAAYRLLIGSELEHIVAGSAGVSVRI